MGLQPSASKTGLLLACQRPFAPDVDSPFEEAGEPSRYGSAFHAVIAPLLASTLVDHGRRYDTAVDHAARKWQVKAAAHELHGHVRSSYRYLLSFLERGGWNLKTVKTETSYAIDVEANKARRVVGPSEDGHVYAGLRSGEIPGTVDLEVTSKDGSHTLILDHKTGFLPEDHFTGDSFAMPAQMPQMKTLGLVARTPPGKKMTLAIFHADRKGMPDIHFDGYDLDDRSRHRAALVEAMGRIGDGSLRPGPQCNVCPAATTCPARAADVMGAASAALLAAGAERLQTVNDNFSTLPVGRRAGRLIRLIKRLEKLTEMGRAEVRALVKAGELVEEDDGTTYELSTEEYETLSKSSIVRALGKPAGERLIASLRKKGVVEMSTKERLVPRAPR